MIIVNFRQLVSLIGCLCLGTSLIPALTLAQDITVGHISRLIGNANIVGNNQTERLAVTLAPIYKGDIINTETNARLELHFQDDSVITLGENTNFKINDYRYAPKKNFGRAIFKLFKGVFRAVSGAISNVNHPVFEVRTSYATIGIRGTDFWGGFHFDNNLDVVLLDGRSVYVRNKMGMVELTSIGGGTTINNPDSLPSTPRIWGEKKLNAAKASVAWSN